jgi:FAD/FMN-containing dehydrogenase
MVAMDWTALRDAVAGEVVDPGSPRYDEVRRPPIELFHGIRPAAVVRCESPQDVATAIAFARRSGLPVAVRSGGHCFAGRSSTEGLLIDVSPMNAVSVAADGLATVGAGARLGQVYDALQAHGRTLAAGCGPTVGIAGVTLGGGLGILGRSYGVTSDQLAGARVVLADGRMVDCDDEHEPGLFWALRGAGGGNFGVVTSLVFRTVPEPQASMFHRTWPFAEAAEVIADWQQWSPDAPDNVAASLLIKAPADPSGPIAVNVFGAVHGAPPTGVHSSRFGDLWTTGHQTGYRQVKARLAELGDSFGAAAHGPEPRHDFSKSEFFAQSLPAATIGELVAHLEKRPAGTAAELDFSPWGGAYNRVAPDATAFVHRNARFLLKQAISVPATATEGERAAAKQWLTESWQFAHPYGTGGVYQNFPDPDLPDWRSAYYGDNYPRLQQVKATYDPDQVFSFHQSVAR